jgi:hypothetical protein
LEKINRKNEQVSDRIRENLFRRNTFANKEKRLEVLGRIDAQSVFVLNRLWSQLLFGLSIFSKSIE